MLDLALAEDLATEFRWRTESPEWTAAVGEAQLDPRMVIGSSDGGAHLARDDGADWSSYFLRSWVLDRKVWTLEEGIRHITQVPAALAGFTDRGTIAPGRWADLMVFDPATIGPWRKGSCTTCPAASIVLNGGAAFARIGTEQSTGTKLFCVSGHVVRPGVPQS
jgi:N-acyl-D-aspartate/D-glutamate deacylase